MKDRREHHPLGRLIREPPEKAIDGEGVIAPAIEESGTCNDAGLS